MRIAVIALLGLVFAAGLGAAAHVIARDTVALPVASLDARENLAPAATTQRAQTIRRTTTARRRTTGTRTATTTRTSTGRTATDDDGGHRGGNRGRGRGGDDDSSGSGSSGSGGSGSGGGEDD